MYTTGARSPHTPRADQITAGVCRHGLGLSWKLLWSRNGPVFQELWAPLKYCAICRPVVHIATYPYIHHRWCMQALIYTTGTRSSHAPRADQQTAGVCRHWLGLSWTLSWSRNGPVFQELWAPLKYCAICRPVVYIATYPYIYTGARSTYTPRAVLKTAGTYRHGLGLSWKLSWSRNGPVFQELWAPLKYCPICRPVLCIATYPCVHHRWRIQALTCITSARSSHRSQMGKGTARVC